MSDNGSFDLSEPRLPPDSPGSSVSTRLLDEYEELLKYAVVVPKYDDSRLPKTLTDLRESFPQTRPQPREETIVTITREKSSDESESRGNPIIVKVTRETGLPDFGGQSPIGSRHEEEELGEEEDAGSVKEFLPRNGQKDSKSGHRTQKFSAPKFLSHVTEGLDKETSRTSQRESNHTSQREVSHTSLRKASHTSQKTVDLEETDFTFTATVDQDVTKMETLMDQWCLDLKRNVMAEFSQSKIRIVEHGRQQLIKEKEKFAAEKNQIQNEMESLKELLHTYEQSLQRKDQVISNLTNAMQKQREKVEMLKKFNEWKLKHIDRKREIFASKLAARHYERRLSQKVWDSWHSVIVDKWRSRVEKACQARAQEVCMNLTNDYETRIKSLTEALESSRAEVCKLQQERERYEETMKKAFMRGVCALNLEAMTMFQSQEEGRPEPGEGHVSGDFSDNLNGSIPEKDYGTSKTIPQEPIYTTDPRKDLAPPKVITSQGSRPLSASAVRSKALIASKTNTVTSNKGKVVTAKITAKTDSGRGGTNRNPTVDPPMSSVIVERHPPVNKETIGQATAGRHPRQTSTIDKYPQTGILHRRIAGQSGSVTISPNVQTVKVVE